MIAPEPPVRSGEENAVREYYDRNTRRFLLFGASRKPMSIHRAVWGQGVTNRQQALEYSNHLLLSELQQLAGAPGDEINLLDLGCGVGGSLFYLLAHDPRAICASGVTLSPVQAQLANETAQQLGCQDRCAFFACSYLDLPPIPPVHLAYAIESFILGPDPQAFFQSAARALRPGGKLVVIDDFLTASAQARKVNPSQQEWISAFQAGWHANSLATVEQAGRLAARAGLRLTINQDLTPCLRLLGARDQVVRLAVHLGKIIPMNRLLGQTYWDSLVGGNALQHGLKYGIFAYHMLVFEKEG